MKSIKMSPAEFEKILSNPIQRNTARHAHTFNKKNGHLSKLNPTHARVAVAEIIKSGKMVKLDGHSRSFLWSRDLLEAPKSLQVDVYPVAAMSDAIELYKTFDSPAASMSLNDQLHGAFRYHNFTPAHPTMFNQTGLPTAMKILAFPPTNDALKRLDIFELVEPWIKQLTILDGLSPYTSLGFFPSFVQAAVLISLRRDGNKALAFWQAYHNDEGTRSKVSKDGMFAAREFVTAIKANPLSHMRGYGGMRRYSPVVFHCYDQWFKGKRIPNDAGLLSPKFLKTHRNLSEIWADEIGAPLYPQLRKDLPDAP